MKVIFNVDAITHPITGIGHYALQLGRQLQQHQAVQDCKFYSSCRWITDINNAANSNQGLSFARKYVPFKSLALSVYGKHRDRCFKRFTSSMQDHVFHSPNFLLMPFSGKSVSTIADLSFIHFPDQHPKSRLKFLEKQLPKTLEQATLLIAISEFVKNEIIDVLSVSPEKIHVTALGVDPKFKIYDHQESLSSLQKHGLHNKAFILSVATTEPRKNLQRLLDAYLLLDHKVRKNHPLVLVGSTGWLNKNLSAK
ncbi:MAG: glycosyltransferase, partial [Proteobacteria bacterium]|nr:glycosyltransferase [Pseudomonadota bacterium]